MLLKNYDNNYLINPTNCNNYQIIQVLETSMIVKSIKAVDDDAEYKCAALTATSKSVESIRLTLSGRLDYIRLTLSGRLEV